VRENASAACRTHANFPSARMSHSQDQAAAGFYILDLYTGDEHIPWTIGRSLPDSIAEAWLFRYPPISIRQRWGDPTRITKTSSCPRLPNPSPAQTRLLLHIFEQSSSLLGIRYHTPQNKSHDNITKQHKGRLSAFSLYGWRTYMIGVHGHQGKALKYYIWITKPV
jgi:hypothetical protein